MNKTIICKTWNSCGSRLEDPGQVTITKGQHGGLEESSKEYIMGLLD